MHSAHATTMTRPEAAILRGRHLLIARAGWAALAALSMGLFVAAVPARLGSSESLYDVYVAGLMVAFGLGCFAVAAVIAWRRSDDFMGLFASLFLVLMGAINAPNAQMLATAYPAMEPLLELSWGILCAALVLFVFIFPDGKFVPRWTRIPVGAVISGVFLSLAFGGGSLSEPPESLAVILIAGLSSGMLAQIYRYARVSAPAQRRQTMWVVSGMTVFIAAQVAAILAEPALSRSGLPAPLYEVADVTFVTLAAFLIPLSIGAAILRRRLWDIDIIINRALVYAALTALVVGIYVLVVGYLGALLRADGNLAVSLVATGIVAVFFAPLRDRLQRFVNHLMYGERDDPYKALSRLGERLENVLAPEAVLAAVAESVAHSLKLPHAAITLEHDGHFATAARFGTPVGESVVLPLTHHAEEVGRMVVSPRSPGEEFSPADRRLLGDLARQAGSAAHAARLTADLKRSRERLVAAREEERRRFRRDLHDGIGPRLATLALKHDAAMNLLSHDREAVRELLAELKAETQEAIADVRRVVHDLRPPALDQLGLVRALEEWIHRRPGGTSVSLDAPEDIPPLSAAVEVAAFRIVQEALTNVARHADARNCIVRLSTSKPGLADADDPPGAGAAEFARHAAHAGKMSAPSENSHPPDSRGRFLALDEASSSLLVEVTDDGRGIGADKGSGVGLSSMRERAEELGGSFEVEALSEGGTRVRAELPLRLEPMPNRDASREDETASTASLREKEAAT